MKFTFEWNELLGKTISKVDNSYSNELIISFTDKTELLISTEDETINILYVLK